MANSPPDISKAMKELEELRRSQSRKIPDGLYSDNRLNTFDSSLHPEILCGIITDVNDTSSIAASRKCIKSIRDTNSNIWPLIVPAVTPETLPRALYSFGKSIKDWTWPIKPGTSRLDIKSGLRVHAYGAVHYKKVVACLVSHMIGWRMSMAMNAPVMILEHDALFTRQFDFDKFPRDWAKQNCVIGLNNPLGATRKAMDYFNKVGSYESAANLGRRDVYYRGERVVNYKGGFVEGLSKDPRDVAKIHIHEDDKDDKFYVDKRAIENPNYNSTLVKEINLAQVGPTKLNTPSAFYREVPWIDDKSVPQGLAGNSAYIMNPIPARRLFEIMDDVGLWPNDALMCKQLLGGHMMRQAYPYFTTLQGVASTTQG